MEQLQYIKVRPYIPGELLGDRRIVGFFVDLMAIGHTLPITTLYRDDGTTIESDGEKHPKKFWDGPGAALAAGKEAWPNVPFHAPNTGQKALVEVRLVDLERIRRLVKQVEGKVADRAAVRKMIDYYISRG